MTENNENDNELWDLYIQKEKIDPINREKREKITDKKTSEPKQKPIKHDKTNKTGLNPTLSPQKTLQMDRKLEEKLRKGKLRIDSTLDLHGFRQNEAYEKLCRFIEQNFHQNKRTLLVITGKGESDSTREHWTDPVRGILKQRVPEWLSQPPCSSMILNVLTANSKHGGSGALYVYLKKKK